MKKKEVTIIISVITVLLLVLSYFVYTNKVYNFRIRIYNLAYKNVEKVLNIENYKVKDYTLTKVISFTKLTNQEYLRLFGTNDFDHLYTTYQNERKVKLIEGSFPSKSDEILLPIYMKKDYNFDYDNSHYNNVKDTIQYSIGDNINVNTKPYTLYSMSSDGTEVLTNELLNFSTSCINPYENEEEYKQYKVVGFYDAEDGYNLEFSVNSDPKTYDIDAFTYTDKSEYKNDDRVILNVRYKNVKRSFVKDLKFDNMINALIAKEDSISNRTCNNMPKVYYDYSK